MESVKEFLQPEQVAVDLIAPSPPVLLIAKAKILIWLYRGQETERETECKVQGFIGHAFLGRILNELMNECFLSRSVSGNEGRLQ